MSDYKEQADEEESKKLRFKGKFQEACQSTSHRYRWRWMEEWEAGYDRCLHCSCHVCEQQRMESGRVKCVDKSCEGCQNLKNGKKIRNWLDFGWASEEAKRKAKDAH